MRIIVIFILFIDLKLLSFELTNEELIYSSELIKNSICRNYCLESIISESNLTHLSLGSKEAYLKNLDIVKKSKFDDNYNGLFNFNIYWNNDSTFIVLNIKPKFGNQIRKNYSDNSLRFILKNNGRVYYLRGFESINNINIISEIIGSNNNLLISYYFLLFNLDNDKFNYMIKNENNIFSTFHKKTDKSNKEIHLFIINNITYKIFNINDKLSYDIF